MDISRRAAMGAIAAAGAATMLDTAARAAISARFFERVGCPIGLQLYTLGDDAGRDLDATFAAVAAIGYRDLQLPGLYGRTPAEVRAAADRAGVAISSVHLGVSTRGAAPGITLSSEPAAIADAMGALGARMAVLPIMLFPDDFAPREGEAMHAAIARSVIEAGPDLWKRTAALLNERAAALAPLGIGLAYHNHNMEFAPLAGGVTGWEVLLAETDPALVGVELDIGWVSTSGQDPVAFLARHAGRLRQMHVKDVGAGNAVNYALSMQPAEVGSGTLDWATILPAAHAAGVRHFYVEQEPPFAIPRIEAVRRAFEYLSRLEA